MRESAPTPGVFEIGQDEPEENPEDVLAALAATSDAPAKKKKKPKPEPEPAVEPPPAPAEPESKSARPSAPVGKAGASKSSIGNRAIQDHDFEGSGLAARARARTDLPESLKPKPVAKPNAPTLPVVCFGCGQRLRVSITHVGKKVKCPRCAAFITVVDPEVEKELEKEVLSAYRPTLSEKINDTHEESAMDDLLPPALPSTRPSVDPNKPPPEAEISRPTSAENELDPNRTAARVTPSKAPTANDASRGPRPVAPARPATSGANVTRSEPPASPTSTTRFETSAPTSAGEPTPAAPGTSPPLFITFHCTGCGQKLKIKAAAVGKTLGCPKCKKMVTVPDLPPKP